MGESKFDKTKSKFPSKKLKKLKKEAKKKFEIGARDINGEWTLNYVKKSKSKKVNF